MTPTGGIDICRTALKAFALETLSEVQKRHIPFLTSLVPEFPFIFVDFVMIFRRIRAVHVLSCEGYAGAAVTILREVKDRTILIAAVLMNRITYSALMGISPNDSNSISKTELDNIRRKRRGKIEREVIAEFVGKNSGLGAADLAALTLWTGLFDREMHGSFLSASTVGMPWLVGDSEFNLHGADNELMDAMFMNRFNETTWMYHRLLPNLQLEDCAFDRGWRRKWDILDESFWQMEKGLTDIGRPIGDAFIRFVDSKFPFDASSLLRH